MKVWYLPLEPYRERYTEQLLGWTKAAFGRNHVELRVVPGEQLAEYGSITRGQVLDAQGRCYYALTQVACLARNAQHIERGDYVFVEDLFTPGFEALPYVFHQLGLDVRVGTRNYAQSVDPDDFTHGMMPWMRPYEEMVDAIVTDVFVASTVHAEMIRAAGLKTPWVVGLPFDLDAVRRQGPVAIKNWHRRPKRVVYASRLDREKQPHLFMDIVEHIAGGRRRLGDYTNVEFVVCTGAKELRSNDQTAVVRLREMEKDGLVRVKCGLTKGTYYEILADARVQLNTARQDFVSFTALEASAFAVPTLAPAFRSFPEALECRRSQLYLPDSVEDAAEKLLLLLDHGEADCERLAAHHDGTLNRMITVMTRTRTDHE